MAHQSGQLSGRAVRDDLSCIVMHIRVRHAQRLEDVRVDGHGEFLAAYALDDCREQPIGAVVVLELRTWSKVEAPRVRQNAHNLSVDVVRVVRPEALKNERVPQPAGVRQQMANRNPVCTHPSLECTRPRRRPTTVAHDEQVAECSSR